MESLMQAMMHCNWHAKYNLACMSIVDTIFLCSKECLDLRHYQRLLLESWFDWHYFWWTWYYTRLPALLTCSEWDNLPCLTTSSWLSEFILCIFHADLWVFNLLSWFCCWYKIAFWGGCVINSANNFSLRITWSWTNSLEFEWHAL